MILIVYFNMARPLTKFGELKKTLVSVELPSKDIDEILQKAIDELKARTPATPVTEA